jgi:hypothetical protein
MHGNRLPPSVLSHIGAKARAHTGRVKKDDDRPSRRAPAPEEQDGPVLPEESSDERDVGWGDEPSRRDADWYRRERPPHHE